MPGAMFMQHSWMSHGTVDVSVLRSSNALTSEGISALLPSCAKLQTLETLPSERCAQHLEGHVLMMFDGWLCWLLQARRFAALAFLKCSG